MPRTSRSLGVLLLVMATATAAVPDLAQLKIAAERGDPVAQFEYARKISLSNPKEQFGWFLKSAQQGYALAQDAVAARLDNEFDPKKKPTAHREAARWASRAAFQGIASAQAKMGRYYDRGRDRSSAPFLPGQRRFLETRRDWPNARLRDEP